MWRLRALVALLAVGQPPAPHGLRLVDFACRGLGCVDWLDLAVDAGGALGDQPPSAHESLPEGDFRLPRPPGHAGLRRLALRLRGHGDPAGLIYAFLPVRLYMVSAFSATSVAVWEVPVLYGVVGEAPREESLLKARLESRKRITSVEFLPSRDTMMIQVGEAYEKIAVFWEPSSRKDSFQLRKGDIFAVSADGDLLAGALTSGGETVWNISSGKAVRLAPTQSVRRYEGGAFSPDGARLATLVCVVDGLVHRERWQVEVWSARSGRRLCATDAPAGRAILFDGSVIAVYGEPTKPTAVYELRARSRRCTVVRRWHREPMQDFHTGSGLALRFTRTTVVVRHPNETDHTSRIPSSVLPAFGRFAPDGRSAVLGVWPLEAFKRRVLLWRFADGEEPRTLHKSMCWRPVYSPDSLLLAGVSLDRRAVVVHNLLGGPALRLRAEPDEELLGLAVSRPRTLASLGD